MDFKYFHCLSVERIMAWRKSYLLALGLFPRFSLCVRKVFEQKSKSQNVWTIVLNALAIIKNFVLVSLLWVFFRGTAIENIKQVFVGIFGNNLRQDGFQVDFKVWLFLWLFIVFDALILKKRFDFWCADKPVLLRWAVYAIMMFSIIVFSGVQNYPFIYFQF